MYFLIEIKLLLYQFEKREVFGDFVERIALGRKEEIIREFLWKFWKSKREKIIFKKYFLFFPLRSQNYFPDLVTRHYLNMLLFIN